MKTAVTERYAPELVFAVVAPSGIDFTEVREAIGEQLLAHGYSMIDIRISSWLREHSGLTEEALDKPDERIPRLQEVGDSVRRLSGRPDALGYIAIRAIAATRRVRNLAQDGTVSSGGLDQTVVRESGEEDLSDQGQLSETAYFVWSLKHEKEAELLRQVYGSHFFQFSIFAPAEDREERLSKQMAEKSGTTARPRTFLAKARHIIETDEDETVDKGDYGQNVRDAYPLADFFLDGSNDVALRATAARAIDIVFGYPFATPTKDEFGMYVADGAALRSAELGRQVGAAIATDHGDVIAIGTNEVPTFPGGHFWADPYNLITPQDNREYRKKIDTSEQVKRQLAREIFIALQKSTLIPPDLSVTDEDLYTSLEKTGLRDLTEYGRAVHAELSALMDAARRGVPVDGQTIYVTTFPCHHCTRHVVAAGLRRLVYIYPYAKSRASELHGDSIQTSGLGRLDKDKVHFYPFLGVAPRRFQTAFAMTKRKDEKTGRVLAGVDASRSPRLPDEGPDGRWDVSAHIDRENKAITQTDGSEALGIQGWLPRVIDMLKQERAKVMEEVTDGIT